MPTKAEILAQIRARRASGAAPPKPEDRPAGGAFDAFTQGASFGFGDEFTAAEAAILGRRPGGGMFDLFNYSGTTMQQRYDEALAAERGQQKQFSEDRPVLSTAANIAGGLATAGGAAKQGLTMMGRGSTALGNVGRGAAEGAAYGALYGAGEAEGDDILRSSLHGAAVGGGVGGSLSGAGSLISKMLAGGRSAAAAPTVKDLKTQADAAYDRARAVNPTFDGFDKFAMDAYETLPKLGYNARLHPRVAVALDALEDISKNPVPPTMETLEQFRRVVGNVAKSIEPDERRIAVALRDGLDDYMSKTAAGAAVNVGDDAARAPAAQAMKDLGEGRALYARAKRGEMVDDAVMRAERRAASTGSGGNVENAIRQNIRAILDSPKKLRGFSKDEIEMMERVVRGEPVQNVMRLLGKLSPQGNGLMMALHAGAAGGAAMTANPLLLAPAGIGAVSKQLADRTTRANADMLSGMVRGGQGAQIASNPAQLSEMQKMIIRLLSEQAGSEGAQALSPAR